MAIWLGIAVAISNAIEIYSVFSVDSAWEFLLPLIFAPTFTGGGFIVLWAVSESIGREAWGEKYQVLDLIMARHFKQSGIGLSLIRGIAFGGAFFSIFLLLTAGIDRLFNIAVLFHDNESFQGFNAYLPAVSELTRNYYHTAFLLTPYLVFVLSLLRKKIYSGSFLVLIGSVLLGMALNDRIEPFHIGLIVTTLSSALLVWVFYRYDIFSAFVVLFTFFTIDFGIGFFYVGDNTYLSSGMYLIAGLILALIYASYTIFSKDKPLDPDKLTPAFVKNITERERLQRELEIARAVQMDFLPGELPRKKGLEVSARCTPALEVGGDYYDFIELGEHRLGVVIGDVSGKGTQAAFYMTLTKGFIKALAKDGHPPDDVLKQANRLFYQNARRNTFISMVYAIFDMDNKTVTLARAGHNPVIMHTSKQGAVDAVLSDGLALGLDSGSKFNQKIKNRRISFDPGDVFVFYTDGLTEALNSKGDEYGETRLVKLIQEHASAHAGEILKKLFLDTKHFSKRTKQHDDMSVVVVKIVE
jgi:hypothetical protein